MKNKFKRILSCLLAAVMLMSVMSFSAFSTGDMTRVTGSGATRKRAGAIYGNYLYTMEGGDSSSSVEIYDISDLSNVTKVTPNNAALKTDTARLTDGKGIITVIDGYLYAGFNTVIRRFSLENPENPTLVGSFVNAVDEKDGYGTMAVCGNWLIASTPGRTASFNMSSASADTETTQSRRFSSGTAPVASDGKYVYIIGKSSAAFDTVYAIGCAENAPATWDGDNISNNKIALATISGATLNGYQNKMQIESGYLYFSDAANKKVYRINLSVIGENLPVQTVYSGTAALKDFAVKGDTLYIHEGSKTAGVLTYKMTETASTPDETISLSSAGSDGCIRMDANEDYLYYCDGYDMNIIPFAESTTPEEPKNEPSVVVRKLGATATGSNEQLRNVVVYGNYAYASVRDGETGRIAVFDITDPEKPTRVTTTETFLEGHMPIDCMQSLILHDGYLYGSYQYGRTKDTGKDAYYTGVAEIRKFDVQSTPENPKYIASYRWNEGITQCSGLNIIDGKLYAYARDGVKISAWTDSATENADGTEQIINAEKDNTSNLGQYPSSNVCNGILFALNHNQTKLKVIDTDTLTQTYEESGVRAAVAHPDGYLYIIKNGVLETVDLTSGKDAMSDAEKRTSTAVASFTNDMVAASIDGNYLWVVGKGSADKLHVFDISNPQAPKLLDNSVQISACGIMATGSKAVTSFTTRGADVTVFEVKDYKFTITSGSTVTEIPFEITGTMLEDAELTLTLKDNETEKTYSLTPAVTGEDWFFLLDDIYSGSYTLTAEVKDNGASVLKRERDLNVSLSKYGEVSLKNTEINETDASAVNVSELSINYATNELSVNGKIPMKSRIGFKEVAVTVNAPSGSEVFSKTQKSLGNFNFTVSLGEAPVVNEPYTLTVSCEGETNVTKTFRYYGTTFINTAVSDINEATEDNVEALLFYGITVGDTKKGPYADALGLNTDEGSEYAALKNKKAVLFALVGQNFENEAAVQTAFSAAVAAQKEKEKLISDADKLTDAEKVMDLIEAKANEFGVNLSTAAYGDLTKDEKLALYNKIVSEKGELTEEKLNEILSKENILLHLINTSGASELSEVLNKYKTELGIDDDLLEKYNKKLSENVLSEVNKTIARTDESEYFTKLADVTELFEDTVDEAKEITSGGGTSSGKGGGKSPSGGVSLGSATKNEEKQEKTYSFSDMKNAEWAGAAVKYLAEKGIVSGKSESEFFPNDSLKREEFIKMLVIATKTEFIDADLSFTDVEKGAWYYPYVATAYELGIVNGMSDDVFGIGEVLTREQMAVMLNRFISYKQLELEEKAEASFNDEISDYAKESVIKLAKAGILNGVEEGVFGAKISASRAMGAKVLYELIMLFEGR